MTANMYMMITIIKGSDAWLHKFIPSSLALYKADHIHLHCIVLYCIVLYCILLHCIALHCIVLYCILYCIVYCIVLCCIVGSEQTTE